MKGGSEHVDRGYFDTAPSEMIHHATW